jgi:mediator of RNA polymerase II transcription subunit 5
MPDAVADNLLKWEAAFTAAKKGHIDPARLPLEELTNKFTIPTAQVANIVIRLQARSSTLVNPLVPRYVEHVVKAGYTTVGDVLVALMRDSQLLKPATNTHGDGPQSSIPGFEEQIFNVLRNLTTTQGLSPEVWHDHVPISMLTRWLHVAREANGRDVGKQMEAGVMHAAVGQRSGGFDALGMLAIAVFSQSSFQAVEKQNWWKARKQQIALEMERYDSHVFQRIQSQCTGQLHALSKQRPFRITDAKGMPIFSADEILGSIQNLPQANTRAGLFIWLNACLCSRPLTDEATMRNHLMVRYHESAQQAASGLLLAAFDVLTNLILRKETSATIRVVRSFICNKLPIVLHSLLGFLEPHVIDDCIRNAFDEISMEPLTPLTAGSSEARDLLKKTRHNFLYACALHSLISDAAIASIMPESPASAPKVTRYTKEGLVAQCVKNTSRLEALIQELDLMQGNAGAIAACVKETLSTLCVIKDTMSLKAVCNALLKKVSNLDVLMANSQPSVLLRPICNILNEWVPDHQEQSECQPPYEEFACILLFLLAAVHRYNLRPRDLNLEHNASFVAKLLHDTEVSLQMSGLTEEQSSQLGKWIEGLYATDEHGDTTGIGDEVMSSCPPQAFYLLVPTLFEQSVLACKYGQVSISTVRGGLEFLLEPFLLPSLVGGISWIVKHAWEDHHNDTDILLQFLDKLLKPNSNSQEMQVMHRAILAIVADDLDQSLRELVQRKPDKKKMAEHLRDILKPYTNQRRVLVVSRAELDNIRSAGGSATVLRNTVRDLTHWAANVADSTARPPNYPPLHLHYMLRSSGHEEPIRAIVAEIQVQTTEGRGSAVIDVCTALVGAPDPATYTPLLEVGTALPLGFPRGLPVQHSVRMRASDTSDLQRMPVTEAEALVRLARALEAQSAVSPSALVNMPGPMSDQVVTDQVMKDLGLTDSSAFASLGEVLMDGGAAFGGGGSFDASAFDATSAQGLNLMDTSDQNLDSLMAGSGMMQVDQSNNIFDLGIDFGQSQNPTGNVSSNTGMMNDATGDDDIFADLDLNQDFDFS